MLVPPALAWLLTVAPVTAPADGLQWTAPPGCPDRASFAEAIERRLRRPLAPGEAQIEARVVRDRGYTLRLQLSVGTRSEVREVHDERCAALADAAAVLVAAAVEPPTSQEPEPLVPPPAPPPPPLEDPTQPVSGEPTVPGEPAVPGEPLEPREPRPRVETSVPAPVPSTMTRRPGGFLRLHGGGELGAVPGPTGAVALAGGLLWPRWRLELQATFLAPRTAGGPPPAAQVGLLAGAVLGCGRLGRGAIEVPLCLGLEAGAMRGEARGITLGSPATSGWLAAVLGGGLAWHIGRRWSVWAAAQLLLAPVTARFELGEGKGARELFSPSVASGRLLLGVELRLADRW